MKPKDLRQAIACLLLPSIALAQSPAEEKWDVGVAVYGYFPDIGGATRFPAPGGEIDIDAQDLIENTEVAFMTAIEAQKGRWGLFADAIYMDVGDEIVGSTTLAQGSVSLPLGVTADAALDIEASVFSVAANLRVLDNERSFLDAFAGARRLDAQVALDASLNSPLGPIVTLGGERDASFTDGVLGVKGKISVGEHGKWFVPFYVDVGTGDSDRTSQAATGIGFSLRWGEMFGTYRYLDYDFDSDSSISDLDFSGPAMGVSYRF